jgi:hypothetical protein
VKTAIINVALGYWYPKGQQRLLRSLDAHGFDGHVLAWEQWPTDGYDTSIPYNCKAAALEVAINMGFTRILWLDCSAWAVRPITPLLDLISAKGYYLASCGYSASQTCNDRILSYAGITRDKAMDIPDAASGTIGLDITHPRSLNFARQFIQYAKDGMFGGNRVHDPADSADPRFLFSRQDQSAATLIAHQLGMPLDQLGHLTAYDTKPRNPDTCIVYRGM